ncbi:VanW family protein [Clostridium sp. AL.422]|uniref:VanW family protein n=1 Tax=Clostridium TaxID=1485 RepID=UPI00293DA3AF|nr:MULTISPECIES: VanW family protein [unclassified Clostridium]MDV4152034.1 VanW family protein [Clostridium sp. AL.422]
MDNNATPKTNEVVLEPKSKIRKRILFIALALIILVTFVVAYIYSENKKLVNSYEDKVYPGTFVFDKDVSGMTKSELRKVLEEMVTDISEKKINIAVGENNFEKSYIDLDTTIDYESFEDEVLSFGKDKKFTEQLNLIKEPQSRDYEFEIKYSEDKIAEFLDTIAEQVNVAAQNASISVNWGAVNVTPGQVGYELNKDILGSNIKDVLVEINSDDIVSINGELGEVNPAITTEALQTVDKMISNYTTYFDPGPSGHNIQVGAGMIGNVLLMPGDTFSTVNAIGPTTRANGFVEANTYLNGKVVPGLGGGVCQISSTIYNAELKAGILPDFRTYHEMVVKYVPQGLDATIGDEWPDLVFTNPYEYPIVVNVYSTGNSVTAEFWSNSQATGGVTYVAQAYQTGPLSADAYLYGYNSAGELVSESYLDSSVYKPFN